MPPQTKTSADTMRACTLVDVGLLELGELPVPAVGPHDVLVEVAAVGLCGTDFHIFGGEFNFNLDDQGCPRALRDAPQVLGHEISGRIAAVGAAVHDLTPGDRVVLDQGHNCHSARRLPACEYCESGDSHQCEHYIEHGITGLQGGFAEYLALPAVNAIKLESELPLDLAALTEPLGCVLHSTDFARRARARFTLAAEDPARRVKTAVILGGGPAGLLFLQVLRKVLGFDGEILLSDRNDAKRRLAADLGARAVAPEELSAALAEHSDGRGAEWLIEATGSGPAFEELPSYLRKQATVLLYGVGHGGASLEALNQVQWKEPTLVTSIGASGGFDPDGRPSICRRALRHIEAGDIEVRDLVTHRFVGLEEIPTAFRSSSEERDYVKGVVLVSSRR